MALLEMFKTHLLFIYTRQICLQVLSKNGIMYFWNID